MNHQLTGARLAAAAAARVQELAPSIADIGRQIAAIQEAYASHERLQLRRGIPEEDEKARHRSDSAAEQAQGILYERAEALHALLTTIPAQTMVDVAVQVAEAALLASSLAGNAYSETEVVQISDKIERMMLGALPIIAAAAGVTLAEMGWSEMATFRVSRFAAVGVAS